MTTKTSNPELKCQILPVDMGNLLIPEGLIADVMILDVPSSNGTVMWRNRQVPLFKCAKKDMTRSAAKSSDRIAILRTITGHKSLPFIALKVSGIPHTVYVSDDMMKNAEDEETLFLTARSVEIGSLHCVIPDLPRVEMMMIENAVSA